MELMEIMKVLLKGTNLEVLENIVMLTVTHMKVLSKEANLMVLMEYLHCLMELHTKEHSKMVAFNKV